MRQARWDHINGIITQEGDKARKGFWRYVKQFKKDNTGITVLKKDGRSATSPQQKAEMLNAQFSSVFTEEDTENLPQLNKQYPSRKYPECVCNWSGETTAEPKCK